MSSSSFLTCPRAFAYDLRFLTVKDDAKRPQFVKSWWKMLQLINQETDAVLNLVPVFPYPVLRVQCSLRLSADLYKIHDYEN